MRATSLTLKPTHGSPQLILASSRLCVSTKSPTTSNAPLSDLLATRHSRVYARAPAVSYRSTRRPPTDSRTSTSRTLANFNLSYTV
jgi:hypothetical protein